MTLHVVQYIVQWVFEHSQESADLELVSWIVIFNVQVFQVNSLRHFVFV